MDFRTNRIFRGISISFKNIAVSAKIAILAEIWIFVENAFFGEMCDLELRNHQYFIVHSWF